MAYFFEDLVSGLFVELVLAPLSLLTLAAYLLLPQRAQKGILVIGVTLHTIACIFFGYNFWKLSLSEDVRLGCWPATWALGLCVLVVLYLCLRDN